ncbi:MAG: hypothetical protein HY447_03275 [Candidatus Omnitrophica bacterium]|nr:hypothetical protein [Candidatus Omnitrophota bacterium]
MNPILLRGILSALPILGFARDGGTALLLAACVFSIFLGATLSFLTLRFVLPEKIHALGYLLILFVLGVAAKEIFAFSSLCFPSLLLLTFPESLRARSSWKKAAEKTFWAGLSFSLIILCHGVLLGTMQEGSNFFQLPGGSYLLLGLALIFVPKEGRKGLRPNRRRKKSEV